MKLLKALGLGILVVLSGWLFSAFYRELFSGMDADIAVVHGVITSLAMAAACAYGINNKN